MASAAAVGQGSVTGSGRFRSGKRAHDRLESDPDWVPSLHMGRTQGPRTKPPTSSVQLQTKQNQSRSAAGGPVRSAALPWNEVKSLLQSVLQGKTIVMSEEETLDRAGRRTGVSFRDFFQTSLATSLEASSRSIAQVHKPVPVSGDFQVDLNFKVPPLRDEAPASCPNCSRMQRRIKELEDKLSRLTAAQEVMEPSSIFRPDPVQCPEPVHTAADGAGCKGTETLSAPRGLLYTGDLDTNPDPNLETNPDSNLSSFTSWSSSVCRLRQSRSFNPAWLKMFWFLRYSQSLDQMWCHVCRIHADESHQNLPLIRGSSKFKIDNIKRHSGRNYHQMNVKRYSLHCWPKP